MCFWLFFISDFYFVIYKDVKANFKYFEEMSIVGFVFYEVFGKFGGRGEVVGEGDGGLFWVSSA